MRKDLFICNFELLSENVAWKTNQRAWNDLIKCILLSSDQEGKFGSNQSTYSKTICVGTESHDILVAIRRFTSCTRFFQTLLCEMMQGEMR